MQLLNFKEKLSNRQMLFVVTSILIILWQSSMLFSTNVDKKYMRNDAARHLLKASKHFTYFYYYLNLYPIATTIQESLPFSKSGALDILKKSREHLMADYDYVALWGDHFRSVPLLFGALIQHNPISPQILPFNYTLLIATMLLINYMFINSGYPILGWIIVLLFGSNPFLLYENYFAENIFSINLLALLLLIGINLSAILHKGKKRKIKFFGAVTSGVIFGIITHYRMDAITPLPFLLLIYLTDLSEPIIRRILTILVLCTVTIAVSTGLNTYYDYKVGEAEKIVTQYGGFVQPQGRDNYHTLWHPISAGLSDFDNKYTFEWGDDEAYAYAGPILKKRYPEKFTNLQRERWSIQLEYKEVIKERLFKTISSDPIWYIKILVKRIFRILTETTPIQIRLLNFFVTIPFTGFITIPLFVWSLLKKRWFYTNLLLLSYSTSLTALLIYSGRNATMVSSYHMVTLAILVQILYESNVHKRFLAKFRLSRNEK